MATSPTLPHAASKKECLLTSIQTWNGMEPNMYINAFRISEDLYNYAREKNTKQVDENFVF